VYLGEQVGDFFLALVQRRANDVRRRLVIVDLEDVLPQIGLDNLAAGGFDGAVQRRLLADHRLRLDGLANAVAPRDLQHVTVDVVGRLGPKDGRPARSRVSLEYLQPDVEAVQRALADRARSLARRFHVVELEQGLAALGDKLALDLLQVALELRIAHVVVGALLEMHRRDLHCDPRRPALGLVAGQQLGDVQDPGGHIAAPSQPALDVEHASKIAQDDRVGLRLGDELTLVVGQAR
jgi:hypothetical protein